MTSITTVLAVAAGRGAGSVWAGLAMLAGQLFTGWSNDYLDRERDRVVGREHKPIVRGDVPAAVVGMAAVAAVVACVPLSLLSGWRAAAALLTSVGFAGLYNVRLKATVLSPLPYAVAFGLLPTFVTLGLAGHPLPAWWAVTAAALLGMGAHFTNTLPDLEADRRTGVVGLPHRLGRVWSVRLGLTLLTAAVVVLAVAPEGFGALAVAGVAVSGVLAVAVAVVSRRPDSRAPFQLTLVLAVVAVGLLVLRGGALA